MKLTDSITGLKGIGPRKAEAFGKLGLFSMHDVLYHFPRKYRDYSKTSCIMGANHGDYVALELTLKSDPKLAEDPLMFPTPEDIARLSGYPNLSVEEEQQMNEAFERVVGA